MESAAAATSAEASASAASLPSVSCSPVSPPPPPNNAAVPDEGDKTCSDSSPSGSSENLPLISLSSEASTGCSPTQNNGVHLPTAPEAVPIMPAEAETSTTP